MTTTALERINTATGEVTSVIEFSMSDYLASVTSDAAFKVQQQLAAAYDKACLSLIGPNDVQKEGSRTFKKKSAWRKLARHFNISSDVVRVDREIVDGTFLATVTVRARGPWGQSAEAVGACGQDEATGRRTITIADAIATAETRATNRAVSNLIAMGEVSAEEMQSKHNAEHTVVADERAPEQKRMPFGDSKGTPLGELSDEVLQNAMTWCRAKGRFKDLMTACEQVLRGRHGPGSEQTADDMHTEQPRRAKGNGMDPNDYEASVPQEVVGPDSELPF